MLTEGDCRNAFPNTLYHPASGCPHKASRKGQQGRVTLPPTQQATCYEVTQPNPSLCASKFGLRVASGSICPAQGLANKSRKIFTSLGGTHGGGVATKLLKHGHLPIWITNLIS